jgi:diguanylate cyclase (GGDEF)-like protein
MLLNTARQSDIVLRFGGDEFVIFFLNCLYDHAFSRLTEIRKEMNEFNETGQKPYPIGFSFGIVQFNYTEDTDIYKIIEQADKEMYIDKKQRKTMCQQNN